MDRIRRKIFSRGKGVCRRCGGSGQSPNSIFQICGRCGGDGQEP